LQELIKKLYAWYRDAPAPIAPTTLRPEVIEAVHWTYRSKSLLPLALQRLTVKRSYDRSARPSWIGFSGYYTCAEFEWAPLSTTGEALVGGMTANAQEHALKIKEKKIQSKQNLLIHDNIPIIIVGGNDNYYHFIIDILPRLISIHYSGLLQEGWKVALCNDIDNLMRQAVLFLDINEDQIIWLDKNLDHWFSRAIYITNANIEGKLHPLTNLLLDRFKDGIQAPIFKDRIFVSRSGISRRRLINEEIILKALRMRKFCIVRPELMSLKQQVETFHSARVVVGVHGSGLTNLIWAQRPRILLELCGSISSAFNGTSDLHFENMALSMEFCKYKRLRAKTENTIQAGDHQSDFFMDPDNILEEIDKLIKVLDADDI